jgi:hypothetical protein
LKNKQGKKVGFKLYVPVGDDNRIIVPPELMYMAYEIVNLSRRKVLKDYKMNFKYRPHRYKHADLIIVMDVPRFLKRNFAYHVFNRQQQEKFKEAYNESGLNGSEG